MERTRRAIERCGAGEGTGSEHLDVAVRKRHNDFVAVVEGHGQLALLIVALEGAIVPVSVRVAHAHARTHLRLRRHPAPDGLPPTLAQLAAASQQL
jgi:hypothetical protein